MRDLLSSLRPALANPTEVSALFVDHVVHALCVHVAQIYGQMPASLPLRGGLAPWQERRAKELLNANLDGEICLSQLAAECGLSVRHFTPAFRRSIGVPAASVPSEESSRTSATTIEGSYAVLA